MPRAALFVAALAAAFLVVSCSGEDTDSFDPGAVLASLANIDAVGFHVIDEALNETNEGIDPEWAGAVRRAQIAVATADWPQALRADAEAFVAAADALARAVEADDATAGAPAAAAAHDAQHELSTNGWALMGEKAGVESSVEH